MISYPFIAANHFTRASRGVGDIDLVCLHTTEGKETPRRSRATAAWFADERAGGSAHYVVDPAEIVQCVREEDVAWGAGGANKRGIHVEHCGHAGQTAEEWDDENSRAELLRSAALVADICTRYGIPAVRLTADEVKDGASGIVGHAECSAAFGGSHWDPGPNFPWDEYLAAVNAAIAAAVP